MGMRMTFVAIGVSWILSSTVVHAEEVFPMDQWTKVTPEKAGMDAEQLARARDYALTGGGSGMIVRGGKAVMTWGPQKKRYDLKSTTKSIGFTAVGLALADGKIGSLSDKARKYHPDLAAKPSASAKPEWVDEITLFHLATHTSGFEKPGGYGRVLFEPGTKWMYSDAGPNWLAECVTLAYHRDLSDLLFERVFTPIGIRPADLSWRANMYRPRQIAGVARREFGAGFHANVDAMARIGLLYLRRGRWGGKQLLRADFVASVADTPKAVRGLPVVGQIGSKPLASNHYGLLWWNNDDGALPNVPADAYWSWGLYDSFIVVIPSLDVVVARAGKSWKRGKLTDYQVLGKFLDPIVASITPAPAKAKAPSARPAGPYPPSKLITHITWAPKSSIIRKASGSDNWPCTWGDDNAIYTAYGDGWGFEPKVTGKLSLGLARVTGEADGFRGVNIRSATGEAVGDGARGKKASGMLMVDGVLYMWVRNAAKGEQSQLAWSADHGKTWTWADWKLEPLGYCTFINFGPNYAGARDEYVYVVSHDSPSAYKPADRFVLLRVPADKITDRTAYEFFAGPDAAGKGTWSKQFARRAGVFEHKGLCMRSGLTYNAPLKRYLWVQVLPVGQPRFAGGFGVYEAPEPWGPWATVYFTRQWDVGPGETASFPPRWISADGKTVHLVFSGGDCFSVRKATLTVSGG